MRGRASLFVLVLLAACGLGWTGVAERQDYPLDDVSRSVEPGEKLPCQTGDVSLVSYRGDVIRYHKPVRIHAAFQAHLTAFETLVGEVATRHFGRAPKRIMHLGAYACRPMRNYAHWMSEHALGNALDVAGFEFAGVRGKSDLPKALRRGFQVSVLRDWSATEKNAEKSAFLHDLTERIIARPDLFRSVVGPGYRNHENHLHLANPPYRMVKVGDTNRWFW